MKRVIVLVLVLLLACYASAEQGDLQIEGEWYIIEMYTHRIVGTATLEEDGCFNVSQDNGLVIVFHETGQVESFCTLETYKDVEAELYDTKRLHLSDSEFIYYDIIDNDFLGYYICNLDGKWNVYETDSSKTMLFENGHATPYKGGDSFDYFVSRDKMYMIYDESYTRGTLSRLNKCSFVLSVDSEPHIEKFGDIEIDYGTPFLLFVSTSIVE